MALKLRVGGFQRCEVSVARPGVSGKVVEAFVKALGLWFPSASN